MGVITTADIKGTERYTMDRCMICERIIKFRWKGFWKRLTSIF